MFWSAKRTCLLGVVEGPHQLGEALEGRGQLGVQDLCQLGDVLGALKDRGQFGVDGPHQHGEVQEEGRGQLHFSFAQFELSPVEIVAVAFEF